MLLEQDKETENKQILKKEIDEFYKDTGVSFFKTYTSLDGEMEWVDPTTTREVFFKIIEKIPDCKNFVFLDCGSGLGHVLHLAYPYFKKVIGIEIDKEVCEESKKNLIKLNKVEFSNITIFNNDMLNIDEKFLAQVNVFYISSPFRESEKMEALLTKIKKSLDLEERDIWLIYYYPYRADIFEKYSDTFILKHVLSSIGNVNIYYHLSR